MSELRFDGRVAVVTGAGRGLGREFALLLAARGAHVVVNDIGVSVDRDRYEAGSPEPGAVPAGEQAASVVDEIVAAGGDAVANTSDVGDPAGARDIVATAVESFGGIDIVINNAGVVMTGSFEDVPVADLVACFDVNVKGPFQVMQAAWGHMRRARYGRILNVCSVDGVLLGNPGHSPYDAAKAGLAGLTRAVASEGAELGIQVNGLLPGARTRGSRSTDPAYVPVGIDMRASLVAPGAGWLVHEQCPANGQFFACSSGRMGVVFTGAAAGFQAKPEQFTLEAVRDNWRVVVAREPYIVPAKVQEYNAFRQERFAEA